MLPVLLLLTLSSNAVAIYKKKSIIYSRVVIPGLLSVLYIIYINAFLKPLQLNLGLYGNIFSINIFTQSSNILIIFLSILILILTGFYNKSASLSPLSTEPNEIPSYKDEAILNKFTNLITSDENSDQYNIIEYALIIVFILCGALYLTAASDLISIFLCIELQSYGLYILCTLHRDSESSTSSGLTYFLLGGLSSCFILFGSALLYVNSGTTSLDNIYIINSINEVTNDVANNLTYTLHEKYSIQNEFHTFIAGTYSPYYIDISLIMIMVGFLFKVSAAPFHFWSPDVYDGIPTIVTTFVATIAKISIFVIILRLALQLNCYSASLYNIKDVNPETLYLNQESTTMKGWKNVLLYSSMLSLVIGSLLGLTQSRIKRLFAYSTISHVGFILLALSIASLESIQGYIFYILQYSISNLNAFFILISIGITLFNYTYRAKMDKLIDSKNSPIQLISQIKGYFHINSFIAISLAITLFSFVGVPPLIGFFAKQMVLSAALDNGYIFMTLVGVITSVIGAAYYLNLVKEIFFFKPEQYELNVINLRNSIDINPYNESDKITTSSWSMTYLHRPNVIAFSYKTIVLFSLNSVLTTVISVFTVTIVTFLYMPNEWFTIASILSITLFNI